LAIEGDLRFLSHHDMMRAVERAACRAKLPLRYTQGFNPHPVLSLTCPRPVGVASRDDLLTLRLDQEVQASDLLGRLDRCAPRGMRFLRARVLEGKGGPRILKTHYELALQAHQVEPVAARLRELAGQECWTVERLISPKEGPKDKKARPIDLKPLIGELRLDETVLRWQGVPQGDLWARPGELLALLGLDQRVDLARGVRTAVEYDT